MHKSSINIYLGWQALILQNFNFYKETKMNEQTFKSAGDLLEDVKAKLQVKNDAALSRAFEVAPPVISKIRHGKLPVGASLIIKIHELTGMTIAEIKSYLPSKDDK